MRHVGLMIAGFFAVSCGSPGADNGSEAGSNIQPEIAVREDDGVDRQAEPSPGPDRTAARNDVQDQPVHPCMVQGRERLQVRPIRALGTEPFWSAKVQGRCVTYSTPENQQGVRVWTRYSERGDGRREWLGQLDGQKFEMSVGQQPGCSDGMSDNRYPMAVELLVKGEKRQGCAAPL